jgi:hypothetical protein
MHWCAVQKEISLITKKTAFCPIKSGGGGKRGAVEYIQNTYAHLNVRDMHAKLKDTRTHIQYIQSMKFIEKL